MKTTILIQFEGKEKPGKDNMGWGTMTVIQQICKRPNGTPQNKVCNN